ncbi:Protein with spectrin repeats [Cryptosporidium felis]|nr:Protein with spectrin repeats [Cryptosporidium felis]
MTRPEKSSGSKSSKYNAAIESGVEILRSALRKKEEEIRWTMIRLKENEMELMRKEAKLRESMRILEQERRNNEYLRMVNLKAERIFGKALNQLNNREVEMEQNLNSILSEFRIIPFSLNAEEGLDSESSLKLKLSLIKDYLRSKQKNEHSFIDITRRLRLEGLGTSVGRCNCGYPIFVVKGELMAAKLECDELNGDQGGSNQDMRSMEHNLEKKAPSVFEDNPARGKTKNELLHSKEEEIKHEDDRVSFRLRELKQIEETFKSGNSKGETKSNLPHHVRGRRRVRANGGSFPGWNRRRNGSSSPRFKCGNGDKNISRTVTRNNVCAEIGQALRTSSISESVCEGENGNNTDNISIRSVFTSFKSDEESSKAVVYGDQDYHPITRGDDEIPFTSPRYRTSSSKEESIIYIGRGDENENRLDSGQFEVDKMSFPIGYNATRNSELSENIEPNQRCFSSFETTPVTTRYKPSNSSSERLVPKRMSPLIRDQRQRLKQILRDEFESLEKSAKRNA